MQYHLKPWAHQMEAINKGSEVRDLALFFEMGTGKSGALINILRHKYQKNVRMMRTIILAPIVTLENWRNEWSIHSPQTSPGMIKIFKGPMKKKKELLRKHFSSSFIMITNYESMQDQEFVDQIIAWRPEILVCDESQRCKSIKSKRAKGVFRISEHCKHRYLLSGTPVLNSPMDIFMQYKILDGGETFGKNFFNFRARYFEDRNSGMPKHCHFPDFRPKPGIYKEFNRIIGAKSLRATKADCLDLPPLVKECLSVELGQDQKRAYKEMRDHYVAFIKGELDEKPKAAVATLAITKGLRLQQICSGFVKTDEGEEIEFTDNPRLKELETLLADLTPNHKVIVWACFKMNYKMIARVCEKLKIEYTELHGGIKDKDASINEFRNDDSCRVVIANARSAGLGVNLIEASYSIYYSKDFSLESDIQSEARNHRGGSERHSKITRIDLVASGTIDEHVTQALAAKQDVAKAILDWEL